MSNLSKLAASILLVLAFWAPQGVLGYEIEFLQSTNGNELNFTKPEIKQINNKLSVFREILAISGRQHVDKVGVDEILSGAFKGMLSSLDKYSTYYTREEYQSFINEMEQKKGVVGVYLGKSDKNNSHIIAKVVEDSPAEAAGVLADDIILSVNGYDVTPDTTQEELSRRLRGRPGTKVLLKVLRVATQETLELEIYRGLLRNLSSVRTFLVEGDILIISVDSFRRDTSKEFEDVVKKIHAAKNIKLAGVIIDLRNNPGGYTKESLKIADLILDGGVITKMKTRQGEKIYIAENGSVFEDLPIVVLVNKSTASASEILTSALKDNQRAIVIGTRTHGKGQGQSLIPFKDGSGAIKLTDVRIYSPLGKFFHEVGIEPHINVANQQFVRDNKTPDDCDITKNSVVDTVFNLKSCLKDLQSLMALNTIRTYHLNKIIGQVQTQPDVPDQTEPTNPEAEIHTTQDDPALIVDHLII